MNKIFLLLSMFLDETFKEKALFVVTTILLGLVINIAAAAIVRFILRW